MPTRTERRLTDLETVHNVKKSICEIDVMKLKIYSFCAVAALLATDETFHTRNQAGGIQRPAQAVMIPAINREELPPALNIFCTPSDSKKSVIVIMEQISRTVE